MAETVVDEEQVFCAFCLDSALAIFPCGHNFCVNCISELLSQGDQWRSRCPQCRRSFDARLELDQNSVLADLVEKQETGSLNCPPKSSATFKSVGCDVCSILPAVKSCLVCLASYCELHIQAHFESPAFKKHKLVAVCKDLQKKICFAHDRLYEFYCRTDQVCVCYMCTMGDHRGHDIVVAEIARAEKAEELTRLGRMLNQQIQQRQKVSPRLRMAVNNIKSSAQEARQQVEQTLNELLASIQRRHLEVMELLQAQEETELKEAEGLLDQVELDLGDLSKTAAELEIILRTNDPIDFLQLFLSLKRPSVPEDFDVRSTNRKDIFKKVVQFVSELQKILENICYTEMNASETKTHSPETPLSVMSEPKTREDFLHYSCYLTLDATHGHPNVRVCEDSRAVEWVFHTSSGSVWPQVLCREGLTGRCYWEVQRSGTGIFTVGLTESCESRALAQRKGFGRNTFSWGLDCFHLSCVFRHGNNNITVAPPRAGNTVGVYLDHRAGILSFYSVSDEMTLLHRARAHFTQPLYPGFALWTNAWQIEKQSGLFQKKHSGEKGHMSVKLINL